MRTQGPLPSRRCQILAACLLALFASPVRAAESEGEAEPERKPYQGSFWGVQAHLGLVGRTDGAAGDFPGPALGVSARLASILSIADVEARLLAATYETGASESGPATVTRLSLGPEAKVHPGFIAILRGDWPSLLVSSFYLSAGADLDVVSVDADAASETRVGLGLHLGAGLDVPITDRHRPSALWLGAGYRLRFLDVDTGLPGLSDFGEHTLLVTLGWRSNDLRFARVPRPTELHDQEPDTRPRAP